MRWGSGVEKWRRRPLAAHSVVINDHPTDWESERGEKQDGARTANVTVASDTSEGRKKGEGGRALMKMVPECLSSWMV